MTAHERLHVIFSGHVQGVGFRFRTQMLAAKRPITGYVYNMPDGRVELVAEGNKRELEAFLNEVQLGELRDYIHKAQVGWQIATKEFDRFDIHY